MTMNLLSLLLLFSLLLLASHHTVVVSGQTTGGGTCNLDCVHGGVCATGPAVFDDRNHPTEYDSGDEFAIFVDKKLNNEHCENCDVGYTGIRCERSYIACNDDTHHCFHGGECIEGNLDLFGTNRHICDCTNAIVNETRYVGKWCEREESNACANQGDDFCGSNGDCNPNGGVVSCTCRDGFIGDHCEYEASAVPDCDLQCKNGGACRLGPLDLPDDLDYTENFWHSPTNTTQQAMHCECAEGYFGLLCERPSEPCGDKHCFNGALCVEHINPDQTTDYYCNCTAANTVSTNFAGKHCQYEAVGFCSFEGQPGQLYCVNDGQCPASETEDCICPAGSGFSGPRCEFHETEEDIADYQQCTTACDNGGKCIKGVKDHGALKFHMNQLGHIVNETVNENFEHCLCPIGFAGVNCEHVMETCEDSAHFCFNGGTCVTAPSGELGCDCSNTNGAVGAFCQHNAEDGTGEVCPTSLGFPSGAFCANGGVCDLQKDPTGEIIQSCECRPDYFGEHCEFLRGASQSPEEQAPIRTYQTTTHDPNKKVVISCVLAGVIGFLVILMVIARTEFSKPQTEETDALTPFDTSATPPASPAGSSATTISADSPVV